MSRLCHYRSLNNFPIISIKNTNAKRFISSLFFIRWDFTLEKYQIMKIKCLIDVQEEQFGRRFSLMSQRMKDTKTESYHKNVMVKEIAVMLNEKNVEVKMMKKCKTRQE